MASEQEFHIRNQEKGVIADELAFLTVHALTCARIIALFWLYSVAIV